MAAATEEEKEKEKEVVKNESIETAASMHGENSPTTRIKVYSIPLLKLVEIPLFEKRGTILDNPPLFPDVNFVPYKGIDSSVSLFLNSNFGTETEVPIIFDETDQQFYTLYRETKKYNNFDPVLYKTDEFENLGASFEIYRTDTKPNSYEDFFNSLRTTVFTLFDDEKKLPSAAFMDTIQPNKRYYYTFRMIDRRGIKSNPSPVFELEMINSDGLIFPIIKPFEFGISEKSTQMCFKKLLNLIPSYSQITPKLDLTRLTYNGFTEKTDIGVQDEALYGKSFKLRMTSKDTGRVIDLNLTFQVELPDE